MDYEQEIRGIAAKVMEDADSILADFNKKVEDYVNMGIAEPQAKKVALKQIKGSFQAALRSKAIPFEGFVFAVTAKRNKNQFIYKDAIKVIDDYKTKYHSAWQTKALSEGIINEKGEPLFGAHNTTEAQKWMRGQVIHEFDWEKTAYGFFRPVKMDESGKQIQEKLRYGVIRIGNPDKYMVMPGQSYKFRASCGDTTLEELNLRAASVTKFENTGPVQYDIARTFIESKFPIVPFIDVYKADDNGKLLMPEGIRFYITEASAVSVSVHENLDVDFVEYQSIHDGDIDDNVSMSVARITNTNFDNAVGLVIYRPYFKKANPEKGTEAAPSGEVIGFLNDPAYGEAPPQTIKTLADEDFE